MNKQTIGIIIAIITALISWFNHERTAPPKQPPAQQQQQPAERAPAKPAPAKPSQATPAQDVEKVELVNSAKAVGHRDFSNAKKVLPEVFKGLEEDFYCGCRYSGKKMDLRGCGYVARKSQTRAERLEWEHVVPAWVLGHQRQCWQQGGRDNCTDADATFSMAEGDLNNLVPSVGEVNGDRSNYPYSAWTSNPTPIYGSCKTIVDFQLKRAQPREEVRGRAARITLYMHARYKLDMSSQDRQLMCGWAKQYPVDAWEKARDKRIVRLQGEGNPLVSEPQRLASMCP